jgi:hypothetical protein
LPADRKYRHRLFRKRLRRSSWTPQRYSETNNCFVLSILFTINNTKGATTMSSTMSNESPTSVSTPNCVNACASNDEATFSQCVDAAAACGSSCGCREAFAACIADIDCNGNGAIATIRCSVSSTASTTIVSLVSLLVLTALLFVHS